MRGKIVVMLVLAVVFGGSSLFVARLWLDGQASRRLAAIEAQVPEVTFATMVVAAEPLRFGTPLTTQNLKTIPWPEASLPEGAFATIEELTGAEPRTALFPLEASEPVLAAKITGPGERAGLSRLIADGHRAVTVRVNDVAGVAGFVLPGDRVDVVLTAQAKNVMTTDVVLQNVKVLSIDQIADERTAEPIVAKAVTLEVDPEGAQKLSLAQTIGTISLSLRGSGDTRPATVATVTPADIGAGQGDLAVATGPEPATAAAIVEAAAAARKEIALAEREPEPVDTAATVSVTRAMVATDYKVPVRPADGFSASARPGSQGLDRAAADPGSVLRQAIAALAGSAAPDEPTDGTARPVPAPAPPTD